MATVSSLPWIPNYQSFVVAPATIQRTISVATIPHPRHKGTRFCGSIWDSNIYSYQKNNCRAFASVSEASLSTLKSIRHEEYGRLLPCPAENVLPRKIEHLVVKEGGPVLDFITKALDLPPLYVADLIHFGAVYYALVCPKPPSTATPEEIKLYKEFTNPRVLRKRPSIEGKTVREAQNTFRITHIDEFVEVGTYVRVHVGGTTDNIEETCATFATRALELTTPLTTTHQIDNCTEGWYSLKFNSNHWLFVLSCVNEKTANLILFFSVVLARTKDYCSVFHRKIREKQVKKLYLALAAAYVPCGVMTHYMRPFRRAPKIISNDFIEEWNLCQLEVLECRKVPWPNALLQKEYGIEDFNWPNKEFAYECKINLLTGRTHQIRAQLAACGAPIVGDSMYMPAAIAELASPGLNPFGKYKKQFESEVDRECGIEEWAGKHGKEPGVAIGLQACQISWDEEMAMVPNCRSFILAPVSMLRTLAAATSHRHKSTSFCCSIWNSDFNFHKKNSSRAFSSDSAASLAVTSTPSSPNSMRHEEYGRLLPCPAESFLPRIEHLVVKDGGPVLDFITRALNLPPLYVADLIHFGAVFYALVCPQPPSTATPEEIKLYKEVTDPSVLRKRSSIKGKTLREAQKTFRIAHIDEFVEAGTYVRVHVRPKRFPSVVLARTKDYCSVFHRKIREKQVKKLYLALAAAYVPCGVMTHYMRPFRMAPKVVSKDFIKGWNLCQLEVLECRKVPWPNALIEKKFGIEDFNWPSKEFAYECKINLLTGRTHQIRAQLAACGAPIVGDSMYTPAAILELASPEVNPFGKYKKQFKSEADRECAIEDWAAKHGKEPGVAIGLQACQISWDEGEHLKKGRAKLYIHTMAPLNNGFTYNSMIYGKHRLSYQFYRYHKYGFQT
ncbi:Pseudouridine synthase, catalytic domain-containing protein [Cynara cardunculus var. scolymus]|uniref:Pseudouridine synthase, catalytic domain-containing protein n=1 Tax=Cynara cardunculus var. scolymus TaxID=59895 RepID=A0A103Y227_CYNCS|nr:Pseudouridine synthase, catalytic domain-containing protein [Cynara cardunculus var. scolymus]